MLADAVIQLAVAKGNRHEVNINYFFQYYFITIDWLNVIYLFIYLFLFFVESYLYLLYFCRHITA